jgi:geranylgeranyl diphosphate synthase type II
MRLGAIVAGATEDQLNKIFEFGRLIGYCFQITDDLLDLTSDFNGQKKQQGNDIYEGKRTVMLIHLLQHANPQDKEYLNQVLVKTRDQKTPSEVEKIISLMDHYGSLEFGKNMAAGFTTQAKDYFAQHLDFLKVQPFRDQILTGIDFILNRNH